MYETDMVFIDDVPFAILKWAPLEGGRGLTVRVELERARLQELKWQPGSWLYDGDIEDPRPLQ
jgi:hypothetical protein